MQMVVTPPKVSADVKFLTSPFLLKILCIPIAKTTVKETIRPSGIADTAKATAVLKISIKDSPEAKPITKTNRVKKTTKTSNCLLKRAFRRPAPSFPGKELLPGREQPRQQLQHSSVHSLRLLPRLIRDFLRL